jgi:hypothetical protein
VWISAVRSEIYRFAEFLRHFIERDLHPRVAFPVHLGITVAEDADKPTLHRPDLSETGTRSVSLEESFLREFLGIRPRSGPPVGNTKEKPLVLPDPIIEGVIAYVHWLLFSSRNAVTHKSGGIRWFYSI